MISFTLPERIFIVFLRRLCKPLAWRRFQVLKIEIGLEGNLHIMRQQIEIMLKLQDLINTRVHADWRVQGFKWYRAIWVECAELMEHFGWKWWKKQDADIDQVKLA